MISRNCRLGAVAALALIAVAGAGCTNSDPLGSHPGQVTTTVTVTNPGAAGFDAFVLNLQQLSFESTDPAAGATIGNSFGVIPQGFGINFAAGGTQSAGATNMPPGTYRLTSLSFRYTQSPGVFFNPTIDPLTEACNPSNCLDHVIYRTGFPEDPEDPTGPRVNGKLPPPELQFSESLITITGITGAPEIVVPDGGSRAISITINGGALAQLFRGGFFCQCGGSCGQNTPAPCVPLYQEPSLDLIAALISVQ